MGIPLSRTAGAGAYVPAETMLQETVTDLAEAFRGLVIETPSWAYDAPASRARDLFARIDDAGEVHRLTGTAGSIALRFPPDAVEDYEHLRAYIEARGLRAGAVHPGRLDVEHLLECAASATALGSPALAVSPADEPHRRLLSALGSLYARLPDAQQLLVGGDWGFAVLICQKLGARAKVLAGSAPGASLGQIVAILADEHRLGGVRITASLDPLALFELFFELTAGDSWAGGRLVVDASLGIESVVLSVVDLQEAYAKALLVDREALREARDFGDRLYAREVLRDAFRTDVRQQCAAARSVLGAVENPLVALRQSDYVET
jgi:L-rhamnose isomerase/sugar isomerase